MTVRQIRPTISNFERRNTLHFYIKEENKPLVLKFLKYIQKDSRFSGLRLDKEGNKMDSKITSAVIVDLIIKYVDSAENGEIPGIDNEIIKQVNGGVMPEILDSEEAENGT